MKITSFTVEHLKEGCVTDSDRPRFSFAVSSPRRGASLARAVLTVGDWKTETTEQILIPYTGPLAPFTDYTAVLTVYGDEGETDTASLTFRTGRRATPWQGKWITDGSYTFTEKGVSPEPILFRKRFSLTKAVRRAEIFSTAMGIYGIELMGTRVGRDYFAPGFTSYRSNLQYQVYDVTSLLGTENEMKVTVAGGWAVGSFVFTRKNRITADRQALLLELRIEYEDGSVEVIPTDGSWETVRGGRVREADFYDGETFDATIDEEALPWHAASLETLKISPRILASYGAPVVVKRVMKPLSCTRAGDLLVYDFGQNLAGVISCRIKGTRGQKIVFSHAEILHADGTPNCDLLRSAKQRATYICGGGEEVYSPRYTYMGFRYVGVAGAKEEELGLSALVLSSEMEECGHFTCSDARINRLQENILWSTRANFMDIPTDCPQRDERMGWTGDIAVFAPTACFNFSAARFLEKWLKDVRAEQLKTGGLPNTVPVQGYGFPATMPEMAVAFWGDACILVPWAEYLARGDKALLEVSYESMKKYVKACAFWAKIWGVGKYRYIWHIHHMFQFGDWLAPDEPTMAGWQKRSKWTATASYANCARMVAKVAEVLGKTEDAERYNKLYETVSRAYVSVFTDGKGKLKKEFQTGYVLPLRFGMFKEDAPAAADRLAALVKKDGYRVMTGFPGTPNILFALADNGKAEEAYAMLTSEACPGWLYEVKAGGTTIWERWDGLKEDGTLNTGSGDGTGGMISFNHYASGAVGEFLYTRVAGLEPLEGGYKKFRVRPLVGGGLTAAEASTNTPYGVASSSWKTEGGTFSLSITVPVGTTCEAELPDGSKHTLASGEYTLECAI